MPQATLLLEPPNSLKTFGEALPADVLEVAVNRVSGWDIELRERISYLFQLGITALGNGHGAGEHLRGVFEDLFHLLGRLHEELIAVKLQSVGVVHRLTGLDADEHVVRVSVVLA